MVRLLSTASKGGALAVVASCLCHLAAGGVVVHGGGGVYSGEKITLFNNFALKHGRVLIAKEA